MSTYLDMVDDTYCRGQSRGEREIFGHLTLYDSNTVGKRYLCLKLTHGPLQTTPPIPRQGASIRLHKGQVKRIIKALQKYLDYAEGSTK